MNSQLPAWAAQALAAIGPHQPTASEVARRRHSELISRIGAPTTWRELERDVFAGKTDAQAARILSAAYNAAKNEAAGRSAAAIKQAAKRLDALNAKIFQVFGDLHDLVTERETLCADFLLDDDVGEPGSAMHLDLWESIKDAAEGYPNWAGTVELETFLDRVLSTSQDGPELVDVLERLAIDAARASSSSLPGAVAAIGMKNATAGLAARLRTIDEWLRRFHVRELLTEKAVCTLAAAAYYGTSAPDIDEDTLRKAVSRGSVKDDC